MTENKQNEKILTPAQVRAEVTLRNLELMAMIRRTSELTRKVWR